MIIRYLNPYSISYILTTHYLTYAIYFISMPKYAQQKEKRISKRLLLVCSCKGEQEDLMDINSHV